LEQSHHVGQDCIGVHCIARVTRHTTAVSPFWLLHGRYDPLLLRLIGLLLPMHIGPISWWNRMLPRCIVQVWPPSSISSASGEATSTMSQVWTRVSTPIICIYLRVIPSTAVGMTTIVVPRAAPVSRDVVTLHPPAYNIGVRSMLVRWIGGGLVVSMALRYVRLGFARSAEYRTNPSVG
jgi:hypothetical protein